MKFLQRSHYCQNCKKNAFFLKPINIDTIQQSHECPRCGEKVTSFWETLRFKHIIPYFIGTPFLATSVIYGFWTSLKNGTESVDIFIMILNILLTAIILIYGMRFRNKNNIPSESEYTLEELKIFRKQIIPITGFVFLGFLIAGALDIAIYFLWKAVA